MTPTGFGAQQPTYGEINGYTSEAVAAAQAQAQIQARYAMALRRPRNWHQVRAGLLRDCERRRFAAMAEYSLPRAGKQITGLTVRFAEAALQHLTNVSVDISTLYDDPRKRIVRVLVMDLENNISYGQEIAMEKTVERANHPRGQVPLHTRTNSAGQIVHLLACTEDDLRIKQESLVSRVRRNCVLRLVPGDILDDCRDALQKTAREEQKEDPQAFLKRVIDGFAGLGIMPEQLELYLGHSLDQVNPNEAEELRGVYAAVKGQEVTWADALKERLRQRAAEQEDAPEADKPGAEPGAKKEPEAAASKGVKKADEVLKKKQAAKEKPEDDLPEEPPKTEEDFRRAYELLPEQQDGDLGV